MILYSRELKGRLGDSGRTVTVTDVPLKSKWIHTVLFVEFTVHTSVSLHIAASVGFNFFALPLSTVVYR